MENKKILLAIANPSGTEPIDVNKEAREIRRVFEEIGLGKKFELKDCPAARIEDLSDALLKDTPQIVQFSGHGLRHGLSFEDDNGRQHLVEVQPLADLFGLFKDKIECVLLNACYSETLAKAISEHIPYVIGTKNDIDDEAAIKFSVGFYKALATGWTIENAFNFASTSKDLAGLGDEYLPVLYARKKENFPAPVVPVIPVAETPNAPVKVFVSYDDADDELRNGLAMHLKLLQRRGIIEEWNDRKLEPGADRNTAILENLNAAQIILLLISPVFLISEKYNVEVERAMERRKTEGVRIIPIILRSCNWKSETFGGLEALPRNQIPINKWGDLDEAFNTVAKEIEVVAENMRQ